MKMKQLQALTNLAASRQPQFHPFTFSVAVSWLALLSFCFCCSSECCISYIPHKDYALIDHVLTTFQVTWEWGCAEKCQQDSWCRSFNFQHRSYSGSHLYFCEISWSTRDLSVNQYNHKPGETYYEPEIATYSLQQPSYFIECISDERKRSCFKIYLGQRKTWFHAKAACGSEGASLAVLQTKSKIEFVRKVLSSHITESAWLGLSDQDRNGIFTWEDGKPLSTPTDWRFGQPYDRGTYPLCVTMTSSWNFKWDDTNCYHKLFFVCEKIYAII